MVPALLALAVFAASEPESADAGDAGDVGFEDDGGIPTHYDTGPLPLDGRTIDFFPDGGMPRPEPSWLHIRGNRVLPEEVYINALHLPPDAQPDLATATFIEESLYGFLVKGGYELAAVGAVVTDQGIDVQIDEGQLEKIVFTGRLTFNTLRFRLQLYIEGDVFNRPALQRQLAALSDKIGLPVVKWSLVPTPHPEHVGPQIESLGAIEGLEFVHARKRYELWFYFEESEWGTGPGLDLRSGYIDGLEVGLNYQGIGRVQDRFRVAASAGIGLHYRIDDHSLVPGFSRAFLEARWFSKQVGPGRVGLSFLAQLVQRQRADLDVEDFKGADAWSAVDYGIRLFEGATLTPSLGLQWTKVFDINQTPKCPCVPAPATAERVMLFGDLRALWVIDPENPRWDRQHKIELGARYLYGRSLDPLAPKDNVTTWWIYERYQKVFEIGWHDFWLKSNARVQFGDVLFSEEQSIGEMVRGVFGRTFVKKSGNLEFEFRFSLNRDVLKVSAFTQVAMYGNVNPMTRDETPAFGIAAGPGFHALIQGMFQMDLYASFGFHTSLVNPTDQGVAVGFVALLNKTF